MELSEQNLLDALVIGFVLATCAKVFVFFQKCDYGVLGLIDTAACFVYGEHK